MDDSKVVATGVAASPAVTVTHGHAHAVAVAAPAHGHAVAAPVVSHSTLHGHHGYGGRDADTDAGHYDYAAAPVAVSAPVCGSVPVRQCKNIP